MLFGVWRWNVVVVMTYSVIINYSNVIEFLIESRPETITCRMRNYWNNNILSAELNTSFMLEIEWQAKHTYNFCTLKMFCFKWYCYTDMPTTWSACRQLVCEARFSLEAPPSCKWRPLRDAAHSRMNITRGVRKRCSWRSDSSCWALVP